jgi:hypothetical protein
MLRVGILSSLENKYIFWRSGSLPYILGRLQVIHYWIDIRHDIEDV